MNSSTSLGKGDISGVFFDAVLPFFGVGFTILLAGGGLLDFIVGVLLRGFVAEEGLALLWDATEPLFDEVDDLKLFGVELLDVDAGRLVAFKFEFGGRFAAPFAAAVVAGAAAFADVSGFTIRADFLDPVEVRLFEEDDETNGLDSSAVALPVEVIAGGCGAGWAKELLLSFSRRRDSSIFL